MSKIRLSDWMSYAAARCGSTVPVVLIVAGTRFEAKSWAMDQKIKRWVFVRASRILREYSPLSRVVKMGTWQKRRDLLEIEIEIHLRDLIVEGV